MFADLIPLWYRVGNALAALSIYIGNAVWPNALAMQCMIRYPDAPKYSILGCVILVGFLVWVLRIVWPRLNRCVAECDSEMLFVGNRTENAVIAGLGIFFGCLIPFLGVSGFGYHAFADRFTIVPSIGLSIALAACLVRFPCRGFCAGLVAAGCLGFGVKTVRQIELWRDDVTLLKNTLSVDRDNNVSAHRALAVCAWDRERNMEAVYEHIKKAYDYAWCDAVRECAAVSAHLMIEACYETGRVKEAEDFYYWFRKVDYRQNGMIASLELLYADAIRALHSTYANRIRKAEDILAKIEDVSENCYLAATLNYLLARETGDRDRIHAALIRCADVDEHEDICCCRWAKRILSDEKN